MPAAGGPAGWARVPATDTRPPAVPEPTTVVSDVAQTDSSVSFHVDRVGTPVEVKVSYFPNWQATGADGPWRVAPNLMVVVPTSHDVTLDYGSYRGRQGRRADHPGRPGRRRGHLGWRSPGPPGARVAVVDRPGPRHPDRRRR